MRVASLDEISDVKKGDKTPASERQWCRTVGKTENCIVTSHLRKKAGDVHRCWTASLSCELVEQLSMVQRGGHFWLT